MANYKNLPISLKIGFTFFLLGLLLLSVLFILLIPKIEKDQYKNALLQTEKMVLLTKSQIDLVVAYFKEYGLLEKNESKKEITNLIDKIKNIHSLFLYEGRAELKCLPISYWLVYSLPFIKTSAQSVIA